MQGWWQALQAYIAEDCAAVLGARGVTFAEPVLCSPGAVRRVPADAAACVRTGSTLASEVRGTLGAGMEPVVLMHVPVPVDDAYFVVRGKRYCVMRFARTAKLLPLRPDGSCLTAVGKVKAHDNGVVLAHKRAPLTPR